MSLSRALRRAQRRILRRGAVQETTHLTRADHSWKLEALEPRVLMSADPFTVALGASAGQVELRFNQTGANRALTVDYSDRADEFYDISDNNVINITGSSAADRIKLTFGDGFDDTGLALSVNGLGGFESGMVGRIPLMSKSTASLVPRVRGPVRLVALMALGAMLSGCGQKGPLFMPGQPRLQMAPTQAEAMSPATTDRLANR